jgi:hypothetical protein
MATYQTTYPNAIPDGYAGMIANGETSNRISRTQEDATAIPFGKAVFRGTGDHGCTQTQTGQFLGISIANAAVPAVSATGVQADSYPQYSTIGILTQGAIWVTVGEDVTDGAQAYVTPAGALVDTASTNIILTGWFFQDTVANGGLCRIAKR